MEIVKYFLPELVFDSRLLRPLLIATHERAPRNDVKVFLPTVVCLLASECYTESNARRNHPRTF
jgi:hypothetical protein